MPRIRLIHISLTAFVCGLIGFLPVLGVLPGLYALLCWTRIQIDCRDEWNPASAYLNWGARLSVIGLLGTALIVAVAILTYR